MARRPNPTSEDHPSERPDAVRNYRSGCGSPRLPTRAPTPAGSRAA